MAGLGSDSNGKEEGRQFSFFLVGLSSDGSAPSFGIEFGPVRTTLHLTSLGTPVRTERERRMNTARTKSEHRTGTQRGALRRSGGLLVTYW